MNNTITIIGSVHFETKAYKIDDLYLKLCEIKPDILLMEFPLEIEPEIMHWMQNNWEKQISVESTSVLKYLERQAIHVRPYDIRGRNDYYIKTRFFEQEEAFGDAYDAYFKQPSPHPDAVFLNRLLTRVAKHYGFNGDRGDRTIEQINSADCDRAMETYLSISRTLLMEIVNTVPELVSFRAGLIRRHNHHLKREKAMVTNILNYNKQYDDKHLVVLCGYCHRFALVKMLSRKQKSDNFILKA